MNRLVPLITLLALGTACGEPPHTSPFDPASPVEKQAKATLTGSVTLEGESDASSITVELQGAERTYSVQTSADGSFRLAGVTPGLYDVSYKTRYFVAQTDTVTVPLGQAVRLEARRLAARRASLAGSALVERLENRVLTQIGGASVVLAKSGSVRGAATPGAPAWRAAAAVDTFSLTTLAGDDGTFTLDGVPAGVYRLVITGSQGEGATVEGITVTGETPSVTLEPIVVEAVTGYFEIIGYLAGGEESNAYTSTPVVTLHLDGFNATAMRIGTAAPGEDCVPGAQEPYQAETALALTGEGEAVVCVQFLGADGRGTAVLTDSIIYDGSPPFGTVLTLNSGAAFVTTPGGNVTLALTAFDEVTRLNEIQIANLSAGSCTAALAAAPAEPFVTVKAWTLANPVNPATGYRTVCARFSDAAGNWSAPVSAAAYFDPVLYAPGFNTVVRGAEGRTDRTRGAKVRVELAFAGAATDVSAVLLANDSSFAGVNWRPFAAAVSWTLEAGDGLKTVYVKVRDFAGNESARLQPQITLDQTGPETPVLALNDVDGDSFPLSATTVELRWTTPSDPDLAGFEVERYVEGLDTQFAVLAAPGAGAATLIDATADSSGYPHHYRIRARDDLGNTSSNSTVLSARPFTPVSTLTMLRGESEARFYMQPLTGTFLISTDWLYENPFPGDAYRDQLGFNVLEWSRSTSFAGFNDEFVVRTSNVDNTLVYESRFKPALDERGFGGQSLGAGAQPYLGVATSGPASGVATMIYAGSGIFMASNTGGTWASSARYASIMVGAPKASFSPSGNIFMTFLYAAALAPVNLEMRSGGVWSTLTNPDPNILNPAEFDSELDAAGKAYLAYGNGMDAANGYATLNGARLIIRAANGTWSGPFAYDSAGGVISALSTARGTSKICLAYWLAGTGLRYVCRTDAGGTSGPVTLAGALQPNGMALGVRSSGDLVIAYVESATNDLKVWDQASNTTATVHTDALSPALVIDADNTLHVAFRSQGTANLMYYQNASGTWSGRTLASQGSQGNNPSMALGSDGRIHIAYGDGQNNQLGYVVLEKPIAKRLVTGIEALDSAIDAGGNVHLAYRRTSTGSLYYAKWNGTTLSAPVFIDPDLSLTAGPSIAVDAGGNPFIVYPNEADTAIRFARFSGTWQVQQAGVVASTSTPRMVLGGSTAHILASGLYIRGSWNSWSSETIPGLPSGEGDITLAANGTVHVVAYPAALVNIGVLKHHSGSLGSWTPGFSDTGWYDSQRIGATPDGKVHIAARLGGDAVHVVIDGAAYTRSTIESTNDVGYGVRFVFDAAGAMHLVYGDNTNGSIRYATNALTGAFQSIELGKSSVLGQNNVLLGPGGAPVVTFANADAVLVTDFLTELAARSVERTTAY